MDPRKGATVTAPDLLKAFAEGRGVDPDAEDSGTDLRIWIAYGQQDSVQYADFPMSMQGMMQALQLTKDYLALRTIEGTETVNNTVILVVSAEQPASFQRAISAADD